MSILLSSQNWCHIAMTSRSRRLVNDAAMAHWDQCFAGHLSCEQAGLACTGPAVFDFQQLLKPALGGSRGHTLPLPSPPPLRITVHPTPSLRLLLYMQSYLCRHTRFKPVMNTKPYKNASQPNSITPSVCIRASSYIGTLDIKHKSVGNSMYTDVSIQHEHHVIQLCAGASNLHLWGN